MPEVASAVPRRLIRPRPLVELSLFDTPAKRPGLGGRMTLSPVPPPGAFRVGSDRIDAGLRVAVAGELDLFTVPLLARELDSSRGGDGAIVVDLAELTFMDGSGLRVFLAAAARAVEQGHAFAIINASRSVRRVFELTATDHLLAAGAVVPFASESTPSAKPHEVMQA